MFGEYQPKDVSGVGSNEESVYTKREIILK